jgi:hypothetical protein
MKLPFAAGIMHYDDPPPDVFDDLEALQREGKFRFANHLAAWIEVRDGEAVDAGYSGRGYICATHVKAGALDVAFQPTEFPELRTPPEISRNQARFKQTTGGRTGVPFPRRVRGNPHLQWLAPTVWTTLGLVIRADGSVAHEVIGASQFPRHWIYDQHKTLVQKVGLASFEDWANSAFGQHSPWGGEDSTPLIVTAESALERQLSTAIMHAGARPVIRKLPKGQLLTEQGQAGTELYLLLDGILRVSVDGQELGDLGPGVVIGERALLEHGVRTASLRAVTDCTVAVAARGTVDRDALASLVAYHRREVN